MVSKKKIIIILVVLFTFMVVAPCFAYTEKEAEEDRNQQKAVLAAIGIVAIVGAFFMLKNLYTEDGNDLYEISAFEKGSGLQRLKFGFNFYEPAYNHHNLMEREKKDNFIPTVRLVYSW
jgi:hypothetical protein